MKCDVCGAPVEEGKCSYCGKVFVESIVTDLDSSLSGSTQYDFDRVNTVRKTREKTWFILLMLILVFPFGLYLMWRYAKWNKFLKIVITLFFTWLLFCGGETEISTDDVSNPTYLDGIYVSESSSDFNMKATIAGDKIEIHWKSIPRKPLYWVGTVTAPGNEGTEGYEWESKADTERMDSAMFSSQDETKNFKYEGGKLIFAASGFGNTGEVVLIKEE